MIAPDSLMNRGNIHIPACVRVRACVRARVRACVCVFWCQPQTLIKTSNILFFVFYADIVVFICWHITRWWMDIGTVSVMHCIRGRFIFHNYGAVFYSALHFHQSIHWCHLKVKSSSPYRRGPSNEKCSLQPSETVKITQKYMKGDNTSRQKKK